MKLTRAKLNELKTEYGEVYEVKVGRQIYCFRPLTVGEYHYYMNLGLSSGDLEDLIVDKAILFPSLNVNDISAGAITSLCNEILEESGFSSVEIVYDNLTEAREETKNVLELMKAAVIAAMPSYRYDDLDQYTLKQLTKLVAVAESVLEIKAAVSQGESISITFVPNEEAAAAPTNRPKADHKSVNFEDLEMVQADPDKATKVGTAVANDPIAAKLHAALRG